MSLSRVLLPSAISRADTRFSGGFHALSMPLAAAENLREDVKLLLWNAPETGKRSEAGQARNGCGEKVC